MENQENSTWKSRVVAAYDNGLPPDYADLQEGVIDLVAENNSLKNIIDSMAKDMALVVLPRVSNHSDVVVIAALDDFIKRRATVRKPAAEMH